MHPRVDELVRLLDLAPHPEGGFYRETSRSSIAVAPRDGRPSRSALTGIYYLLPKGQHSAWHVVDSDEIWTHFEGEPVRIWTYDPATGRVAPELLGPLGTEGCEPQRVVGAGIWQAAEPVGEFGFGACFVGPGFDFADFRLLEAAPAARWAIERLAPELIRLA